MATALIIGGGPAGLMAADVLSAAGLSVTVAEAKPTMARKFLMAGKSGLNLTKDEPADLFARQISAEWLRPILLDFGPEAVRAWAEGLGAQLFTGSSGRVFPTGMKASPLLRAWLARLAAQGVTLRTRWRWTGFQGDALLFQTPDGPKVMRPDVTILALGGASWPRLGSDAAWVPWLREKGVEIAPFRPANMGFQVDWSDRMRPHFGKPVKACALSAGGHRIRAEFILSEKGVEGGGIYALSALIRDGADLTIDLLPDLAPDAVVARLGQARRGDSVSNTLRKALGLDSARLALAQEWGRPLPAELHKMAQLLKNLPARLGPPRPLAEAISSAGGITGASLTPGLEMKALPGFFAAGEMLDWEAPTGGYLLTACLATGRHAAKAALARSGP